MKTVSIYALCEPGTRTLRYIGGTYRPARRQREHWNESRKHKTHLGHWLSSLSQRPAFVVLREVPFIEWEDWERRYIRNARMMGFKLVNGTDGGDGNHNPSPEVRKKMGADKIGKKASAETKAKMSASSTHWMLGKHHSPEAKEKSRLAHLGRKQTAEEKKKQVAAQLGLKKSNNTSGFAGVCWDASKKKWQARISAKFIGRFSKIEDAVFARALVLTSKDYGTCNN